MMKSYFRKPLYLILYGLLVFVGLFALAKIGENIDSDKKEYKYIYENTEIKGEIVEATSLSGENTLKFEDLFFLFTMDELKDIYSRTRANAYMTEEKNEDETIYVFASNDIDKLIERNLVTYDKKADLNKGQALVAKTLAEKLGLDVGDEIRLWLDFVSVDGEEPLYTDFLIKDLMDAEDSVLGEDSIIIHNKTFFDDEFLQNHGLWEKYGYFVGLSFAIDPSFNNVYDKVKEKIDDRLAGKYLAPTNSRDFYNVIKPLEEKIKEEERLVFIIKIALAVISSLILILKARSESMTIMVRKIFGESDIRIFLSIFLSLGLLVLAANLVSYLIINSLSYIGAFDIMINLLINILVLAIGIAYISFKDIFILYQKMED